MDREILAPELLAPELSRCFNQRCPKAEHAVVELGAPFEICRLKLKEKSAEETMSFQRIRVHGIKLSLNVSAVDSIKAHLSDEPWSRQQRCIVVREHSLQSTPWNLCVDTMNPM